MQRNDAAPASQRDNAPGQAPARAVSRKREPSWGRVLLTTVQLWASRRLCRAGTARALVLAGVIAAVAALAALYFTGTFSSAARSVAASPKATQRPAPSPSLRPSARAASPRLPAPAQSAAAGWIAGQVSGAAVIGCSPVMCTALQAQGVSAGRLVTLAPGLADIQRADVIVTDAAYRQGTAGKLQQDAPALIASFGSGSARIEVRAVARGGTAAYQSALRSDLAARQSAGAQLLRNSRLSFSAAEAAQLRAGEVDTRVLATLAELSTQVKLRVLAFGGASPGVAPLFRTVTLGSASGNPASGNSASGNSASGSSASSLGTALATVSAQEGAYRSLRAAVVKSAGQDELVIEFAAPSPLGLLTPVLSADRQPATE